MYNQTAPETQASCTSRSERRNEVSSPARFTLRFYKPPAAGATDSATSGRCMIGAPSLVSQWGFR
jgi:hypothetical protein